MPIAIREAVEGDAPVVAALLSELGYPCAPEQALARMRRLAGSGEETLLVAELARDVVGLAAYRVEWALELERPHCRLVALVVAAVSRGRGVGSALVQAVEHAARERRCERLALTSGNWRPQAHCFYESLGFEETGRRFAKQLP